MKNKVDLVKDHVRRNAMADELGVNRDWFYQCLSGQREMGSKLAARIEVETGGKVTRQMLCQKSYREHWPELARKEDMAAARRRNRRVQA